MTDKPNQDAFLYEQVAAELADLIRMGTFRPGERLPFRQAAQSPAKNQRQHRTASLYAIGESGINRITPSIWLLCMFLATSNASRA